MENAQQPVELDLNPIARVIGFLGMYVAHVQCAAGYEYGQQRPAAMKGEPDLIDEIMADRQPIVNFMGSGASDQLMIKDIQAALDTYNHDVFTRVRVQSRNGNRANAVSYNQLVEKRVYLVAFVLRHR